jgi:hypothetical protein
VKPRNVPPSFSSLEMEGVASFEEMTGLTSEGYQHWSPSGMHERTKKYQLIVFDWDVLFDKRTNRVLPGVYDTLWVLKHFFGTRRDGGMEMCILRDRPNEKSNKNQVHFRGPATGEEIAALEPLVSRAGITDEPLVIEEDVCFCTSRKTRKPSPAALLHFMNTWNDESVKDYGGPQDGEWPDTKTLFVGGTWSHFSASVRANADFAWGSRFFGGFTGLDYWRSTLSTMDFDKDWFSRENSCPFSFEQRCHVKICWTSTQYDPSREDNEDPHTMEGFDMVLNTALTAFDMKQQILLGLGYETVVGLGSMKLFYVDEEDDEWTAWPEHETFDSFGGAKYIQQVHLSTSNDLTPSGVLKGRGNNATPAASVRSEMRRKQQLSQRKLLEQARRTLVGGWKREGGAKEPAALSSTSSPSLAKGMEDLFGQHEALFYLLRIGIVAFSWSESSDEVVDPHRVRAWVDHDPSSAVEGEPENIQAIYTRELAKNKVTKVGVRGIPQRMFDGNDFHLYNKDTRFTMFDDQSVTLYCFDLVFEKRVCLGFLTEEKRDVALRAFYYYMAKSPVVLPENGSKLEAKFVDDLDKSHTKMVQNVTSFIEKFEGDGNEEYKKYASTIIDEEDVRYMGRVKGIIEKMKKEKPSEHLSFGKVMKADEERMMPKPVIATSDSPKRKKAPRKSEANEVIMYQNSEVVEDVDDDRENEKKLQADKTFLMKGFASKKHKRARGDKLSSKYFWVNFKDFVLYWQETKPTRLGASSDKGIPIGHITKIVQGQEFNPRILWRSPRKCCLTIAGFFMGRTIDLEFESKKACNRVYHALHYVLFRNHNDDIRDSLIFKDENTMKGLLYYQKEEEDGTIGFEQKVYAKLDHGSITVYALDSKGEATGSPIHVYEVAYDTRTTRGYDGHPAGFRVTFQHGDLLHEGELLLEQTVMFKAVDGSDEDSVAYAQQWVGKINTVAKNLKLRFDTNQKIIQHGKNFFHDEALSAKVQKAINNHGTWFSRTFYGSA